VLSWAFMFLNGMVRNKAVNIIRASDLRHLPDRKIWGYTLTDELTTKNDIS
jgi:hypothetical protein